MSAFKHDMQPKTFRTQRNIGRARYVLTYCTGEKFHNDGSMFGDIEIFSNKRAFQRYERALEQSGYTPA